MPFGVMLKGVFSPLGALDVSWRYLSFFGQPMGEKRHLLTVKEIQDAVVHTAVACAKLIETITEVIRLGAAKLMASLGKSANAGHALGIGLPVFTAKRLQPCHDRSPVILILVKKHLGSGQSSNLLLIAILLYPVKALHARE
jgi:hypothetical protein